MPLPSLTPTEAKRLLERGALLVDIREADEHARENIPGAKLIPCPRSTRPISPCTRASR